ncbi:hypothetical protein NLG97_g5043 [Lecanicillium saksenae]|uniref:Uncharacterized protein n=1 Tax=Lecanicillium saksenae TaxID=468837 RepID=A0ACC1QW24_9HYPO|nr:hypothetical protein NLG97_g5043 [Lecanicillium saksenae]
MEHMTMPEGHGRDRGAIRAQLPNTYNPFFFEDTATMRSIVSLHIGRAGCRIGDECWELYCQEHGISLDGRGPEHESDACFTKFFHKTEGVDTFPVPSFATWSPPRSKQLKKQAEKCDGVDGVLIYHSLGGGTGAGFGARLLEHIKDEHGKSTKIEFSVYPGDKLKSSAVQVYNSALATHATSEYSDFISDGPFSPTQEPPQTPPSAAYIASACREFGSLMQLDLFDGKVMGISYLYRGKLEPAEVKEAIFKNKMGIEFTSWDSTAFRVGIEDHAPRYIPGSGMTPTDKALFTFTCITATANFFHSLGSQFDDFFAKRESVQSFVSSGVKESEFSAAREVLAKLQEEHSQVRGGEDDEGGEF